MAAASTVKKGFAGLTKAALVSAALRSARAPSNRTLVGQIVEFKGLINTHSHNVHKFEASINHSSQINNSNNELLLMRLKPKKNILETFLDAYGNVTFVKLYYNYKGTVSFLGKLSSLISAFIVIRDKFGTPREEAEERVIDDDYRGPY